VLKQRRGFEHWVQSAEGLIMSSFLIDLYVGTYRLSSHARLEAFVIQTKLVMSFLQTCQCKYKPEMHIMKG